MNKRNITTALGLLSIGLVILAWLISPHRHTRYADTYDAGKYDQIKVGLSSSRVLDILGTPLTRPTDANQFEYWHYSGPEVSPSHMVSRCVVIKDGRVARVVRETRWDPIGHIYSGGKVFKKVEPKQ